MFRHAQPTLHSSSDRGEADVREFAARKGNSSVPVHLLNPFDAFNFALDGLLAIGTCSKSNRR